MSKHGLTRTTIGNLWNHINQRCFNPKNNDYKNYGARGIVPCEFIKASPANLLFLLGERPSPDLSIERIDNSLGYYCGQCEECIKHGWPNNIKWATKTEQAHNKRNNRLVYFNGVGKRVDEWAKELGLSSSGIRGRAGLITGHPQQIGWSTTPDK